MKNIFIATIVAAAMLFSGLAVFGQQVDVTQLTANGDWAVAPDSSGVVVSTAENGFAEYLIEVNTEHGYSSATVSVTNSGYFVDEFGDSAAFLVVPHVLQREHELAFAIRLVSPDSNELIDINSASSSASQTWLDEYLVWVTQALGDGWSELDVEIENFVGVDGGDIYNASATGEAAYQPISFGNDDDEELPWYHGESIGRWFFGLIGLGGVEKNIESNKNRLNNLEEGPLEAGGNFHLDSTTRHTLETAAEGYIEYFAAGGGISPVTKGGIVRRTPRRPVATSREVVNSAGETVIRRTVRNEDDLLAIAEDAAGGSLDNYVEYKPNWWQSPDGKRRIEFNLEGHSTTNEGPHVTIRDFDGKRHAVVDKFFIEGLEFFQGR